MRKNTKLGTALLAVGIGSATATVEAANHGAMTLVIAGGITAGASAALGAVALVAAWATRRPGGDV